jgi:hypothetical protein
MVDLETVGGAHINDLCERFADLKVDATRAKSPVLVRELPNDPQGRYVLSKWQGEHWDHSIERPVPGFKSLKVSSVASMVDVIRNELKAYPDVLESTAAPIEVWVADDGILCLLDAGVGSYRQNACMLQYRFSAQFEALRNMAHGRPVQMIDSAGAPAIWRTQAKVIELMRVVFGIREGRKAETELQTSVSPSNLLTSVRKISTKSLESTNGELNTSSASMSRSVLAESTGFTDEMADPVFEVPVFAGLLNAHGSPFGRQQIEMDLAIGLVGETQGKLLLRPKAGEIERAFAQCKQAIVENIRNAVAEGGDSEDPKTKTKWQKLVAVFAS